MDFGMVFAMNPSYLARSVNSVALYEMLRKLARRAEAHEFVKK